MAKDSEILLGVPYIRRMTAVHCSEFSLISHPFPQPLQLLFTSKSLAVVFDNGQISRVFFSLPFGDTEASVKSLGDKWVTIIKPLSFHPVVHLSHRAHETG